MTDINELSTYFRESFSKENYFHVESPINENKVICDCLKIPFGSSHSE